MNRERVVESLTAIGDGISVLIEEFSREPKSAETPAKATAKKDTDKAVSKKPKEVKEVAEVEELEEEQYTKEYLDEMKYNDLKKLCAELELNSSGTRNQITQRILDYFNSEDEEEVEEVKETKKEPAKKPKESKGKVLPMETEEDEFDVTAKEVLADEDTTVEDVLASLKEVGVKSTKKNVQKDLAQALRDGLLDTDDDDGEYEDDQYEEVDVEDAGFFGLNMFNESAGYNDPENMTAERLESVTELLDSMSEEYYEGKLESDEVDDFLEEFATEEELESVEDENQKMFMYVELKKRFIDDDGVTVEPNEPYSLGDEDFCCGHPLKLNKKSKKYVCSICKEEYEAE